MCGRQSPACRSCRRYRRRRRCHLHRHPRPCRRPPLPSRSRRWQAALHSAKRLIPGRHTCILELGEVAFASVGLSPMHVLCHQTGLHGSAVMNMLPRKTGLTSLYLQTIPPQQPQPQPQPHFAPPAPQYSAPMPPPQVHCDFPGIGPASRIVLHLIGHPALCSDGTPILGLVVLNNRSIYYVNSLSGCQLIESLFCGHRREHPSCRSPCSLRRSCRRC